MGAGATPAYPGCLSARCNALSSISLITALLRRFAAFGSPLGRRRAPRVCSCASSGRWPREVRCETGAVPPL